MHFVSQNSLFVANVMTPNTINKNINESHSVLVSGDTAGRAGLHIRVAILLLRKGP